MREQTSGDVERIKVEVGSPVSRRPGNGTYLHLLGLTLCQAFDLSYDKHKHYMSSPSKSREAQSCVMFNDMHCSAVAAQL